MKIQEKVLSTEHENDFTSLESVLSQLSSGYPFEEQVCEFYTRPIYFKFQHDLRQSTSYKIIYLDDKTYTLTPTKGFVSGYGRRAYMVYADVDARSYACECSKMKRGGILCCRSQLLTCYADGRMGQG
jgi:hypothetical protein